MFRAQSTLENSHLSSGFSWIKFQIILSWRVPVWTTTSFSVFSSFSFCFLHEKTLNLFEIEKKIGAAGSYCMDQSYFRILFLLVRKSKQSWKSLAWKNATFVYRRLWAYVRMYARVTAKRNNSMLCGRSDKGSDWTHISLVIGNRFIKISNKNDQALRRELTGHSCLPPPP